MILKNVSISFQPPKPMKKSTRLFKICLALFITLGVIDCANSGPDIKGCVVNSRTAGFNCVQGKTRSFVPFKDGQSLICISTDDLESFLKSCKQGIVLDVTQCSLLDDSKFSCVKSDRTTYSLAIEDADNYFCLNARDQKRIIQRCHKF